MPSTTISARQQARPSNRSGTTGGHGASTNAVYYFVRASSAADKSACTVFLLSGLSMFVMPERRMSALHAVWEGLGLGCRDVRVGAEIMDEDRLDLLVRLLALVGLAAVGHKMVAT